MMMMLMWLLVAGTLMVIMIMIMRIECECEEKQKVFKCKNLSNIFFFSLFSQRRISTSVEIFIQFLFN